MCLPVIIVGIYVILYQRRCSGPGEQRMSSEDLPNTHPALHVEQPGVGYIAELIKPTKHGRRRKRPERNSYKLITDDAAQALLLLEVIESKVSWVVSGQQRRFGVGNIGTGEGKGR